MKGKKKEEDIGVVEKLRPTGKDRNRKETCTPSPSTPPHTHTVRKGNVCGVAFMESSTRI